jgi:hypothetical protein
MISIGNRLGFIAREVHFAEQIVIATNLPLSKSCSFCAQPKRPQLENLVLSREVIA